MTLEAQIEALTKATVALTAETAKHNELLTRILSNTPASAAPTSAAAAPAPTTAKPSGKKATTPKADPPAPATDTITQEAFIAKVGEYLGMDNDENGRTARRAVVKELFTGIGATRASEVKDADRATVLRKITEAKAAASAAAAAPDGDPLL